MVWSEVSDWREQAGAAAADLAAAVALCWAAGGLEQSRRRSTNMAVAYLSCGAAALLAGCGSIAASARNALLLVAIAAALHRRASWLSALLLAAGSLDWIPGAVLLAVPAAALATKPAAGACSSNHSCTSMGGAVLLKPLAAFCCCFAASAAALVQLHQLLLPQQQAAVLGAWLGAGSWQTGLQAPPSGLAGARPSTQQDIADAAPLAWAGSRASQPQPHHPAAALLPAASLQPGLGLHWYLLAQAFPRFRAFFQYCLDMLPAATMLPLVLRFPRQPELLLASGALMRCLLHPRPVISDAVLAVGLLPLARRQLQGVRGLPWLALAMAAAVLLSAASMELWLGAGSGNANFLYGMNLLWAGLQVLLLLQLLRAAARQELLPAQGAGPEACGDIAQPQQEVGPASASAAGAAHAGRGADRDTAQPQAQPQNAAGKRGRGT